MILSDRDILWEYQRSGGKLISPFDTENLQPASVDLRLAKGFLEEIPPFHTYSFGETKEENFEIKYSNHTEEYKEIILPSGRFILVNTIESVEIPDYLCAHLQGKSSLGRLGITVHQTAGFIDPGFKGRIVLEVYNISRRHFVLTEGMLICQIQFLYLSSPCQHPYGSEMLRSRYQNQEGVVGYRE